MTVSEGERITTCWTDFALGTSTTFWTSSRTGWVDDLDPERAELAKHLHLECECLSHSEIPLEIEELENFQNFQFHHCE